MEFQPASNPDVVVSNSDFVFRTNGISDEFDDVNNINNMMMRTAQQAYKEYDSPRLYARASTVNYALDPGAEEGTALPSMSVILLLSFGGAALAILVFLFFARSKHLKSKVDRRFQLPSQTDIVGGYMSAQAAQERPFFVGEKRENSFWFSNADLSQEELLDVQQRLSESMARNKKAASDALETVYAKKQMERSNLSNVNTTDLNGGNFETESQPLSIVSSPVKLNTASSSTVQFSTLPSRLADAFTASIDQQDNDRLSAHNVGLPPVDAVSPTIALPHLDGSNILQQHQHEYPKAQNYSSVVE